MIASNYIKHPGALRFQCEMFSNGYKNSPRIMRLMTVIFKQTGEAPAWVKEAAAAAKRLVKMWKGEQITLNFLKAMEKEPTPEKRVLPECPPRFKPHLTVKRGTLQCGGHYRNFCSCKNTWATFTQARDGQYSN